MQSACHVVKRITTNFHLRIALIGRSSKRMAHCHVRYLPEKDRAGISFKYGLPSKMPREFYFERRLDETVGEFIERIKIGIEKKCLKKKKKNIEDDMESFIKPISISLNGIVFTNEAIIGDSMVAGSILKIDECTLPVIVNAPLIKTLTIPETVMAGFPVLPMIDGVYLDKNDTEYVWGRFKPKRDGASKTDVMFSDCEEVGRTCVYNTTVDDVGWMLMLKCIPRRKDLSGNEEFAVMKHPISPGPGICPFETRHLFTDSLTESNGIRVMSYNILADFYADTDFSRDVLYSYCAPYALKADYRKPMLLKEIYGYNCDIMCLQEVDRKGFRSSLSPTLDMMGFTGMSKWKGPTAPEGEAIFFRKSKFCFVADHSILLSEQLQNNPAYADIAEKISIDRELTTLIEGHGAVLQVVILKSTEDPTQVLCVANTHLYFKPDADTTRLLQSILCVKHLEQLKATYKEQGMDLAIIFCGDFNSRPARGVHQFVTQCHVPSDLSDWNTPGKPEDAQLTDMTFSHSLSLFSACGYPTYTNFVSEFHEMLDYVFIDSNRFTVEKVVPPPDHDEVTLHTALPSVVFPSDHIAQVCDIKFIETDMEESQ